jgi:hypothetical protein
VWLEPEPEQIVGPAIPAPLTVGVRGGSFERCQLDERAVVERFAEELRGAQIFQGVMYPVPPDVIPTWELELSASDEASEPDSNFWKSALASALPPAALFVRLQSDYTLRLEALALRDRVLVQSYATEVPIRNRWQAYANTAVAGEAAADAAVRGATRRILDAVARDLARWTTANRE